MKIDAKKLREPIVTLLSALVVTAMGILLLLMDDETAESFIVLVVAISILLGGISFLVQSIRIKKYLSGIVGLLLYAATAAAVILLQYVFPVVVIAPCLLVGLISIVVGLVRAAICINCFANGYRGGIKNGISAIIFTAFGIFLVFFPLEHFSGLRFIIAVYLFFIAFTMFGDFYAEVSRSELEEDRMKRRTHIALPNIISAFKIKNMVKGIYKEIEDEKFDKQIHVEYKKNSGFDHINLEINLHLTDPKGNQFGHMEIAMGDTAYSYGTYDKSKNRLAGFISQGTYAEIPKLPYYKYCIDNCGDYIISYGACLSEKQLQSVKDKLEQFKEYCEPLELEIKHPEITTPEPGKRYTDAGEYLIQFLNAKLFTVVKGSFKSYFGVNVNCVQFADWLLSDTGLDAVSFGGLRTPGTFYYMLEGMFERPNNRIVRKVSYYTTENIEEVEKLKVGEGISKARKKEA